jgi:hypothetical protein
MLERELKRYTAYFRGWCQAFGEHDSIHGDHIGVDWLITPHQVGLVLPGSLIKPLHREVLLHREPPALRLGEEYLHIGTLRIDVVTNAEKKALEASKELLSSGKELHVYLTSHLMYGEGRRIITISDKKPLSIIYKEIGTMRLEVD